jgi:hypothetical protein
LTNPIKENAMDTWNLSGQRAAASRARAAALQDMFARITTWLRRTATPRPVRGRTDECLHGCG